ncbi:MAG TPA: 16S rRNA (guanine(527)-N(7))-methyltransferase RsmG [Dietzia timorensis]|uniref:Ribosomal RNA small subunit methyltransferase G n=1 Tax=Dietzia timorensis TaxID=499555 RepID=A0A921F2H0_9ACTN|nr:16S rRNA (guanine(527)-N(7))-methyltransferase RsmG [Dietzia timorensis]HJE90175.1 16S rRNA (guanine(527)-N(7))-methyltransferase RsmG [Dietzia timorensis]
MTSSGQIPEAAESVFGDYVFLAEKYVEFLRTAGLERGLLGPREGERLWERHVLNSTAVSARLHSPRGGETLTVTDIGSGAGLPGIPLALCRPDIKVSLVEPLLRRSNFLEEAIETIGLREAGIDVDVIRGRADDAHVIERASESDVVTARAVAPLAKLAGWTAPLIRPGGQLIALKGESAPEELERDAWALRKHGLVDETFDTVEVPGADPTYLIIATKSARSAGPTKKQRRDKLGADKRR